jgi:Zn-dependent protease with chaperone function
MNAQPLATTPSIFRRWFDALRLDEVTWAAAQRGIVRYPRAVILALLGSWSLLAFALWVAVLTGIIGGIVGFFGAAYLAQSYVQGSGSAVGVIGGLLGALSGIGIGFVVVFGDSIIIGGYRLLVSIASGLVLAGLFTGVLMVIEPWLMYFHGYRPPSRREERVVHPVLQDVAAAMGLRDLPQLLISDTRTPGAWTHTRHVVVSKRLLDLPRDQLGGILAHELEHWRSGDVTGLLFVSMCALPLVFSANIIQFVGRKAGGPLVAFFCTLLVWPFLLISRLMIQPVLTMEGRNYEYEADAAAARAGYGPGLLRALEQLRPFEQERSGWEHVLNATHPPMEYRIEALEDELARAERTEHRATVGVASTRIQRSRADTPH